MSMAQTTSPARAPRRLLAKLKALFAPRRRKRLDPRTLPDHLKRDIGFLDGRTGSERLPDFASSRWMA